MQGEPDHDAQAVDEQREGGRHDDLARHRVGAGDEPQQIAEQDEHKERRHEGKEPHALLAHRVQNHAPDELHQNLGHALQPGRDQPPLAARHV